MSVQREEDNTTLDTSTATQHQSLGVKNRLVECYLVTLNGAEYWTLNVGSLFPSQFNQVLLQLSAERALWTRGAFGRYELLQARQNGL